MGQVGPISILFPCGSRVNRPGSMYPLQSRSIPEYQKPGLVLEGCGLWGQWLHAYTLCTLNPSRQGSSFHGPPQGCVMSRLNIPDEDDDRYASNFHPGILSPARMSRASFVPRQRFPCRRCKLVIASLAQQKYVNTTVPKQPKSCHKTWFHGCEIFRPIASSSDISSGWTQTAVVDQCDPNRPCPSWDRLNSTVRSSIRPNSAVINLVAAP